MIAVGYGILRGQKIHTDGLKGIEIHNNRERPSKSNPDIDRKRTVENYSLLDEGGESLNKRVNARCKELSGGRKVRSDAVKMYDFIATASPEDMKRMSPAQQRQYFQDTTDFLIKKFGRANIMYAKVHMDETTPHMHVGIVPELEGRLCAKKLFTPKSMRKLQDEYFRDVSSKYGLQRGEVNSKRHHESTRDYKWKTNYNGKEKGNLAALEKAAKERPVTEGFLNKKIIGYQVSPEWLDESLRLARLGGQAADEAARADDLEKKIDQAKKNEIEANREAARLRLDNEDLQNEIQKKEKALQELKRETDVFTKAPQNLKKPIKEKAAAVEERNAALCNFIGHAARTQGKKALENPAVNSCLRVLQVNGKERAGFIKDCAKAVKGEGKGGGAWAALPAPAKIAAMPLKLVKGIVDKTISTAKDIMSKTASLATSQAGKEITAGFQYLKEHDDIAASPWSWLSNEKKEELIRARSLRDDY